MTDPSPEHGHADHRKPLMRCLGEFVGGIWHGVSSPARLAEHRRVTEETEQRATPAGPVTLRRTIIEEVILPTDQRGRGG